MKLLIVIPNYPNLNSSAYQFVHERVKKYQEEFDVEVFCYDKKKNNDYIFEGVKVTCGSKEKLNQYISSNSFTAFAFHFLSLSNARFIKKYLKNKKVYIWFHGSDCISYKRRLSKLNYNPKKLINLKFLYRLLVFIVYYWYRNFYIKQLNKNNNITFVFVSNWLRKTSEKDLHIKYKNYKVISNFIDGNKFSYLEKTKEDRFNILSINNYSSDIYGGDMTRDIILKLSNMDYFKKFKFTIYGQGVLFDLYTKDLKEFDNVILKNKNLSHDEIKELHQKNGIFLYPKRGDSQGVSRCEAMSSGLVSIASDVEAISEFSPSDATYLAKNIDDFIKAFTFLYENPNDYLIKSQKGYRFINEKCSYENTILKEIKMFEGEEK